MGEQSQTDGSYKHRVMQMSTMTTHLKFLYTTILSSSLRYINYWICALCVYTILFTRSCSVQMACCKLSTWKRYISVRSNLYVLATIRPEIQYDFVSFSDNDVQTPPERKRALLTPRLSASKKSSLTHRLSSPCFLQHCCTMQCLIWLEWGSIVAAIVKTETVLTHHTLTFF